MRDILSLDINFMTKTFVNSASTKYKSKRKKNINWLMRILWVTHCHCRCTSPSSQSSPLCS